MWILFVTWSSMLSATCSYCYKYSWNVNDDGYQYHPQQHHYAPQTRSPRDTMVDLINDFGLKLLAIHNENNENNIALSPYGAFSVLVALGEGVRNEAAHEIAWATRVPSDVRIVRVGLRDIHRHLKSYFIPKEGFLGGLTFNDDNVVLNPEYEAILRFYGYDVSSFNNALYPDPATTERPASSPTTTFNYALSETDSTITTVPSETTTMAPITTTGMMETTTVGATSAAFGETSTEGMLRTTTEAVTTTEASTRRTRVPERPTGSSLSTVEVTSEGITTEESIRTTKIPEETTLNAVEATSEVTTTEGSITTTGVPKETTGTTLNTVETSTVETTSEGTTAGRVSRENTQNTMSGELTTTTNAPAVTETREETTMSAPEGTTTEITTTNQPQTTSTEIQEELTSNSASTESSESEDSATESEDGTTEYSEETESGPTTDYEDYTSETTEKDESSTENNEVVTTEGNERKRRSIVDYLIARYYDDHHYKPSRHYQHSYQPEEPFTFLVYNKFREGKINYMRYDTVLPFHYVPHLDALALSFPLDSSKYYLLLLLPAQEKGIDKLICDIRVNTNLKYIIDNLRYTHVIATIPSFTLRGYVSLTRTLQKLGIGKVFEPRQADFSPMTNQSDIYVKNIEQAITVTIRNYVDPTLMEPYRNLHQTEPVYFKADHPFLYFVIDSELHVTLMAGKVVNPINSRIS